MQIGNLSRTPTPREQPDNATRQAMRILLVIGLMIGGSLVLWRSTGSNAPAGGILTAAAPQILAGETQTVELPARASRVQVADADHTAPLSAPNAPPDPAYLPASGSKDTTRAPTAASPVPLMSEQASAALQQAEAAHEQPARPVPRPMEDMNMTGAVTRHASLAEPAPATASTTPVDLNRAPFEQLNSLKGAGALGRAIIKGRPYKSVDDLVKKKVVRRTVYERIKDQITVQ